MVDQELNPVHFFGGVENSDLDITTAVVLGRGFPYQPLWTDRGGLCSPGCVCVAVCASGACDDILGEPSVLW